MTVIRFLKRAEINDDLWNSCVENSEGGLIYAGTPYLDTITDWNALVMENYGAVMPLPFRKKYGIRYLYQPAFCQQLGVIGEQQDSSDFIATAKTHFSFAEINLNFTNTSLIFEEPQEKSTNLQVNSTNLQVNSADLQKMRTAQASSCNNFVIDLSRTYQDISAGYSSDLKKNLARCTPFEMEYHTHGEPILGQPPSTVRDRPMIAPSTTRFEETISLYKETYGHRFPNVKKKDYDAILHYCKQNVDHYIVREVRRNGRLLSAVLCLKDAKRIYFLMSTTLQDGRKMEANHFLIDNLIREFATQHLVLDFEGSDLEGVASFYKGFGAVNQPYPTVKWNKLKWPWKLLKR